MKPPNRREQILVMWSQNHTAEQICEKLECARETVFQVLARARKQGDTRAERRTYRAPAHKRRLQIKVLAGVGASPAYISKALGVSAMLVSIRLRELAWIAF